jgi:hypothetical protein
MYGVVLFAERGVPIGDGMHFIMRQLLLQGKLRLSNELCRKMV